jgi:hypothetical protein
MLTLKRILVIALLITMSASSFAAEGFRRDGNWWLTQSEDGKGYFILGVMDGLHLGRNFAAWNLINDKSQGKCFQEADDSFEFYVHKLFMNVTSGQVSDGLDVLYKDYRNRSIRVVDGVWVVANSIAGTPQKEIDTMTEGFRKYASKQ